jgi:hypothetical protein
LIAAKEILAIKERKLEQMKEKLDESNSIVESQRTHKARAVAVFSSWQWQKMKLEREVKQAEHKTQESQNEVRVVELS